jgi:hypothetical protein
MTLDGSLAMAQRLVSRPGSVEKSRASKPVPESVGSSGLVNEAYGRLIDVNRIQWQNRAHLLAFAAQTMRRIPVEFARNRHRQKRGGDVIRVALDDAVEMAEEKHADLVALERCAHSAGELRCPHEPAPFVVARLSRRFGGNR